MITETTMDWLELERALFAALEETGMLFQPGAEIKQVQIDEFSGKCLLIIEGDAG